MVTTAEIIFVGLCSFLNIRNLDSTMPPPSVLVTQEYGHYTFLAWDTNTVSVTGATGAQQLGGSTYYYIPLGNGTVGDEVTFNDDRTKDPSIDASFSMIADFKDYSGIGSLEWDTDYVPPPQQQPSEKEAAGFVLLGNGELSAERPTKIQYEFRPANTAENPANARCYAREGHYKFTPTSADLLIETRSLDGNQKRRMVFKPKGSVTRVEIWIGNSTDPIADIMREEPASYSDGKHFATFYRAEKKPDDLAKIPLPRPVALDCDGKPVTLPPAPTIMLHHDHGKSPGSDASVRKSSVPFNIGPFRHPGHIHILNDGDPDLGYCGPEGKP